jgi:SAM-dependent methyltransferase
LAENYDTADALGLAPILHPRTPNWYNKIIDLSQYRAVRRALALALISPAARFLDVGCGTGRWLRRYGKLGFSPVGVDATFGMLRIAHSHGTICPLVVGMAYDLPFPDSTFDCVTDITVVQHIPYELQTKALREMVRVLRPGGWMVLLELVRGEGAHIFPHNPRAWIEEVESCGAKLKSHFGQEFFFLDRFFVYWASKLFGRRGDHVDLIQQDDAQSPSSKARRLYWNIRHITVSLSAWTDPIFARVCPASSANHSVFIFRKND